MFIQKAVENLLADRDIKRAAHAELRATCEQVLEEIRYNDYNFHFLSQLIVREVPKALLYLNPGPLIFLATVALRVLPVHLAPSRWRLLPRRPPYSQSLRDPKAAVTCPWRGSLSPSSWHAAQPSHLA